MDFKYFKEILNLIEIDIMPDYISAAERLTLTIRFLPTGESFGSLRFQFRISYQAISYIKKSFCNAIVKYLVPLCLKVPSTEEAWLSIAENFVSPW